MVVIENLIPQDLIDKILSLKINYHRGEQNQEGTPYQIAKTIHNHNGSDDEWVVFKQVLDLLEKKLNIKIDSCIRCKINNLEPCANPQLDKMLHVDMDDKGYKTLICYLTDSDGDTVVGNFSYTPKKGHALFFDSNIKHRPTPPTKHNRYVINYVLKLLDV
jgi:hypothetical protein